MQRLLEEIRFRNPARATEDIARLSGVVPQPIQTKLRFLLASSPDPDEALHLLERLGSEQHDALGRIIATDAGLQYLIAVFSYSRFLSEAVLKQPQWLEELVHSGDVQRRFSAEEYEGKLEEFLGPEDCVPSPLSLAVFRRRQVLRIVLRDVLGLCALSEVTEELSSLADAVLEVSYRRIRHELVRRHGVPRCAGPAADASECGFAVISLGKLGGKGLNYSSDIDLMFLYAAGGETDGPLRVTNKEFYKKVANQYTELLSKYTSEGLCYRVDLRLRPDGRLGEVCISLDGARDYYRTRARDWELQMLIKGRVSAGDRRLGRELLEFVEPLIYSTTLDFRAVESMSATRERISEKLATRRGWTAGFDIKLAPGGIRDIEFLVQCLQRLHGGREPWVRHGGTLLALSRLRDKELLSDSEFSRLATAYQFLRHLEHRLQLAEDRQTHALPTDPDELDVLARRMPLALVGSEAAGDSLLGQLNHHLEEVQEIYGRIIHAQRPLYYSASAGPVAEDAETGDGQEAQFVEPVASNLIRFLDQRAPSLAAALMRDHLRRGQRYLEHFLERILPNPEWLGWLDADPVLAAYTVDLFEHSNYFSEQLVRNPELIRELRSLRDAGRAARSYSEIASHTEDVADLRLSFRREMFHIQCDSICLQAPIFETLERTSDLAESVIQAAYRMALHQTVASHPPSGAGYAPADQMTVIALGRLGMREFDLASDADLVFALRDTDGAELPFWTRVAERMIEIITSYTGHGVMFAVDTRLRPNGREGDLVQLEGSFKDYFSRQAEAWEGITYMKSRAICGGIDHGTEFLHELQNLDWRRYGQSGRSRKQLAQMRSRLDREQGAGNPLKAGKGGYYDIDFSLMYLRLKSAGIFYKVLNTPARIDVVEQMGHLERADADFLRDAATFYRAVDHGLRVSSGHAEGNLPNAQSQLENLTELVCRWTPDHLHDQPLDIELSQIRARTREFFERLFGS